MMLNSQNITPELKEKIYYQVIGNSAEDSFWFGLSNICARGILKERGYSYLNDLQIENLCIEANNEAERCSDNLSARIAKLSAEIERELPLEDEISKLKDYGPMIDDKGKPTKLFENLEEWQKTHNYVYGSVRRKEFICAYLRGCLKERSLTQKVEPKEKIPTQIMELFKIPLSRNTITISNSPLVDEKGSSSYRFITLCSVCFLMEDWLTNKGNTDIPPTKVICEWVYAKGTDKEYHPLHKKTVENYR